MFSKKIAWLIALGVVALIVVGILWYKLYREVEQDYLKADAPEEWFKYGSIGSEETQGIPYWIWRILPKMFPEYLPGPGGYAALGFAWEQGQELPVGFSRKTIGFPRVAFNCAFCHTATYRLAPGGSPTIVPAGPGNTIQAQGYSRFFAAAASDARFNPDEILKQIGLIYDLAWLDRLLYRYLLIPATKKAMIKNAQDYMWTSEKPPWGTGRIDPFNPIKFGILEMGYDRTIGNADMMPLWNLKVREGEGKAFHWDGLNTSLHEVVVSSAIGDGMSYKSIARDNLDRIENWIKDLAPPASPFSANEAPGSPYFVDAKRAAAGERVYIPYCADCHGPEGKRTGTVISIDEVGTDRHRVDMWTAEAAKRYNAYQREHDWGMRHFQDKDGYVAVPLEGLWLRGPYLHNGSVPTVRDLLKRPEERPRTFYRGYDALDPIDLGFLSQGPEAERAGFRYDTRVPGNGNQGHVYGTDLPEEQKTALLEYLKTR